MTDPVIGKQRGSEHLIQVSCLRPEALVTGRSGPDTAVMITIPPATILPENLQVTGRRP